VIALVAIVAVVGTVLALGLLSRPAPVVPHPQSVVRINHTDGVANALVDIEDPTEIVLDRGVAWVLSVGGRTLNRIDERGAGSTAVGLPAAPTGLALSDGALWITTGFGSTSGESGLLRVGMTSRRVEQTYPLGEGAEGVAVGEDAVWVTNRIQNTLTRVDLTTLVVGETADMGEHPIAVVVGGGSVWVANAIDRTIWRLDPRSLARTAEVSLAANPYDMAVGFDRLWVSSEQGSSVTVIDVATNTIQRTISMPGPARGIAAGPSDVWVAIGNGDVVRIDPGDPEDFTRIRVGGAPQDVAVDATGGWVTIRE
jgi:DNA-binding beta-propeller fold protein YncE